jgi:hypothetical protein
MFALLAATGVVLAACGGSGGGTKSYADVQSCLVRTAPPAGLTTSTKKADMDLIARKAGQGAVVVSNDVQEIQVVVERSEGDAQATEKAYGVFADAFSSRDNLKRYGNVVVAYTKTPSASEKSVIEDCVK